MGEPSHRVAEPAPKRRAPHEESATFRYGSPWTLLIGLPDVTVLGVEDNGERVTVVIVTLDPRCRVWGAVRR